MNPFSFNALLFDDADLITSSSSEEASFSEDELSEELDDSDEEFNAQPSMEDAGVAFFDLAVGLHMEGKLSAKSLCILCWCLIKCFFSCQ